MGRFESTRWSVVRAASGGATPEGRAALETLCATYWYPLYAYARRAGRDAHGAEDAVQGFLTRLIASQGFATARPDKGRFRDFLLAAFRFSMSNETRHARAQKRGGGKRAISLDAAEAEERYRLDPSHDETPERLFERAWARTVLDVVMHALAANYAENGKTELFEALKDTLGADGGPTYRERGDALGMSEAAVKTAVHRLKQRYRDLLETEIAHTLGPEESTDDEIRALRQALER